MHTHLSHRRARPRAHLELTILLALAAASPHAAWADAEPLRAPPEPTLEQHLHAQVPGELTFEDTRGDERDFYEFADKRAPTLLVLASAHCQAPCRNALRQVISAVPHLGLEPGRDFRLLTISTDPKESRKDNLALQQNSLASIGYRELWRWPHLRGRVEELARLTAILGVGYVWDEGSGQYLSPPVVILLNPQGQIARYLQGADLAPRVMAQALRAASVTDAQAGARATAQASSGSELMRHILLVTPYLQSLAVVAALVLGLTWLLTRVRRRRTELERRSSP